MTCGIYCLTDKQGKRYIGKSKNIENRIRQHSFSRFCEVIILEECSETELSELEWSWCVKLKPELNDCIPYVDEYGIKRWANMVVRQQMEKKYGKQYPSII